jgi:hypothetical protein
MDEVASHLQPQLGLHPGSSPGRLTAQGSRPADHARHLNMHRDGTRKYGELSLAFRTPGRFVSYADRGHPIRCPCRTGAIYIRR